MTSPVAEWRDVDADTFARDIVPRHEPAVLRGVVRDWPAVAHAASPQALAEYLAKLDSGRAVNAILMPPAARGRIFYNERFDGFGFARNQVPVSQVLEQLGRYSGFADPPSVAVQSAPIADCLPGFLDAHRMPLLDPSIAPRIWIGNHVVTPAHFDEWDNVGCVVSGRRRFTLFPPEQIGNLYIGPLDFAPTGTPISLVSLHDPDFARFPRFRDALAAARQADLEPGDALYIPALWYHHVESTGPLSVLVNYWWRGAPRAPVPLGASAQDCLLHCILHLRALPPEQREHWRAIFDHYVFDTAHDPAAHIPAERRGVLGPLSDAQARQVRDYLADKLRQP
jgi:hypothetical protein